MNDPVDPVERSADERDRFRDWDAAYVLGALSPDDRRAYERHLANTPARAAEVAELAGLPGLLGKLSADEAVLLLSGPGAVTDPQAIAGQHTVAEPSAAEVSAALAAATAAAAAASAAAASAVTAGPASTAAASSSTAGPAGPAADARQQHHEHLAPLGRSHHTHPGARRRRLRLTFSVLAAGAAALIVAGSLYFGATLAPSLNEANPTAPASASSSPVELAMTPVVPGVMTANLAVTEKGWGTRFDWNCQYTSGAWASGDPANSADAANTANTATPVDYDLVITETNGTETTVATWSATQDGAAGLVASTSVPTASIRSVEIRPTGSSTVLVRTDL